VTAAPDRPEAPADRQVAAIPSSVAFVPAPPLLLPAVAGRAADDTAALRAACVDAVAALLSTAPDVVVVVGAAPAGARFGSGDAGDLRGFGVDLEIPFSGPPRPGGRRLPLAHTVGAWLLDEAGHDGPRLGVDPAGLADALAGGGGVVPGVGVVPGGGVVPGVLAVGDGSARRTVKAPGYLDPAAAPFDAAVAAALGAGDPAGLAALDTAEGERLLASGVPTWRAVGAALAGRAVAARLRYDDAPFGVGYLVADWRVA
jgi:hypothetical protein